MTRIVKSKSYLTYSGYSYEKKGLTHLILHKLGSA